MFNYQNFEEVFDVDPTCCHSEAVVNRINKSRKTLEGLFIDKVLKMLGIKRPQKYYPVNDNKKLRELHEVIVKSNGEDHHKISVLFYILLDLDDPAKGLVYSTEFADSTYLPEKYIIYMRGLWSLDQLKLQTALQFLTHPSLTPTFQDDIIEVLVRHAEKGDLTLALAYYQTVQPTLVGSQALETLFSAMARTSVMEAFYFARSQPLYAQRHMFGMLISLVLNNSPKATAADRSVELVNLPLTEEEEQWFEEYLTSGDGSGLRNASDTLMMRKIATGKFEDSLSLRHRTVRPIDDLDWVKLSAGLRDGLGARHV